MNENRINLADHRGETSRCPMCHNADIPAPMRIHCKLCLTSGYVAKCLPCKGTGSITAGAVWDGGASSHSSTCNICGGAGTFPSRIENLPKPKRVAHKGAAAQNTPVPAP